MNRIISTAMRFAAISVLAGCASIERSQVLYMGRKPVVAVKAIPLDPMSQRMAGAMNAVTKRCLAARGFDVTAKAKPDFSMTLTVSFHADSSVADWHVYEAAVGASAVKSSTAKILASTMVKEKGSREDWRMADIEEVVANILAPKLEDWLVDTISSLEPDAAAP